MTDEREDQVTELVSSHRTRGLVFLGLGLVVGLYALAFDPQGRVAWLFAGAALVTGLLSLLMAPLHGKAATWGARKGEERRRRREAREERA